MKPARRFEPAGCVPLAGESGLLLCLQCVFYTHKNTKKRFFDEFAGHKRKNVYDAFCIVVKHAKHKT